LIPVHTAGAGEIMEILWSDYYGAVLFGEGREIACIPHKGCRLEVVATAPTSHREVNFLLPGQVIRYTRSFFFVDRFELPSGTKVGLSCTEHAPCADRGPHGREAGTTRIGPCHRGL